MNRLAIAVGLTALLFVPLVVLGGGQPMVESSVSGPSEIDFHEDDVSFEATLETRGGAEVETARLEFVDRRTNGSVDFQIDEDGDRVSLDPVLPVSFEDSYDELRRDRGSDGARGAARGQSNGAASMADPLAFTSGNDTPRASASNASGMERQARGAIARAAATRIALARLGGAMIMQTPFINDPVLYASVDATADRSSPGAGYGYGGTGGAGYGYAGTGGAGYGYGGGSDASAVTYQVSVDGHAFVPRQSYGLRLNATTTSGEHFTSNLSEFEVTHRHLGN